MALLVLAAMLAISIPAFLPPTPGVTYGNFSRIDAGMTRAEVEALLGPPTAAGLKGDFVAADGGERPVDWCYWRGRNSDKQCQVFFDKNGRVLQANWNGLRDDRNALEKLRDRLPLIAKDPPAPMAIY
jgi:hypothetical protein